MAAPTVTAELRVRGTELGPGYAIHASHFSRYFEHARWHAFGAPGFALTGKILGGVVRAQTIEIHAELGFDEAVAVTTWLARVGKTSFDFGQRLARPDGIEVARCRCTIVHVGESGPAPLDPALAAFTSDAPLPSHDGSLGSVEGEWFELPFVVRPSDLDTFSHVNQARYIDFVDDARLLAERGEHPAGAGGKVRRVSLEYLRETRAGDAVVSRLAATGPTERRFELVRGAEVLTRASLRLG